MFDFKFDWCKEMEIGVPIVDAQHQELFRIGRDLEQLIFRGQNATKQELLNLVCELREYISYHFYTEEELMATHNYPSLSQHITSHNKFRTNIVDIDLPLLGQRPDLVLPQIKESLQDFLFNHVLTEDKALGLYIIKLAS